MVWQELSERGPGRGCSKLPPGLSPVFPGGARTGRRLTPPGGTWQILSPARPPSRPVTCGDADPPRSIRPGTAASTAVSPLTLLTLLSGATAATRQETDGPAWLPGAGGHAGSRAASQSPCGGGQWLPGNGPGARVRGRGQSGKGVGVVAGWGVDLPIRKESFLCLVPGLLPGLGRRRSWGK